MSIPLYAPLYQVGTGTGTFTSKIFFTIPLAASLFLLSKQRHNKLFTYYRNERWIIAILILALISLLNTHNYAIWSTIAFIVLFLSYILFFKLIYNTLNPIEVLEGVFASFLFLCVFQFILAILYPLMGISFVTAIFQAGGEDWATRNGTRPGAIGVFVTPANLGLFTTIAAGFFYSTFLTSYKKKLSLILLIICALTIFLTFSRTSYVTLVVVLFFLFYIIKNASKPLISFKSFFLGLMPALLFLYWIIFFSPLSAIFLKTNADEMYQARLDHWLVGLEIFRLSPIFGVGINTHLEFVTQTTTLYKLIHNEFLTTNPIHNMHLIILAETGAVGFLFWLVFLITSFAKAKFNLAKQNNMVFSATQVALIITIVIYGFTDWAPLSQSTFPFILLFTFFSNKYNLLVSNGRIIPG